MNNQDYRAHYLRNGDVVKRIVPISQKGSACCRFAELRSTVSILSIIANAWVRRNALPLTNGPNGLLPLHRDNQTMNALDTNG